MKAAMIALLAWTAVGIVCVVAIAAFLAKASEIDGEDE